MASWRMAPRVYALDHQRQIFAVNSLVLLIVCSCAFLVVLFTCSCCMRRKKKDMEPSKSIIQGSSPLVPGRHDSALEDKAERKGDRKGNSAMNPIMLPCSAPPLPATQMVTATPITLTTATANPTSVITAKNVKEISNVPAPPPPPQPPPSLPALTPLKKDPMLMEPVRYDDPAYRTIGPDVDDPFASSVSLGRGFELGLKGDDKVKLIANILTKTMDRDIKEKKDRMRSKRGQKKSRTPSTGSQSSVTVKR